MGQERESRRPVRLLREDGSHRCWISRVDRQKLVEGGHVVVVDENSVRFLSDEERREGRKAGERTLEAAGIRVWRRQRGLGKIG